MSHNPTGKLIAGVSGGSRNACAALTDQAGLLSVCAQERVTRLRGAGVNPSGLPDEAIGLLLERAGRRRGDLGETIVVGSGLDEGERAIGGEPMAHDFAHACTAQLTSPFSDAAIVICDHESPQVSVWDVRGGMIRPVDWPWDGCGFADVYSRCARAFGFAGEGGLQRFEALARLRAGNRDSGIDGLLFLRDSTLEVAAAFEGQIANRLAGEAEPGGPARAALAAAVQSRIGELFVEFLAKVRTRLGHRNLCIGGSFGYHSAMNTAAVLSGLFAEVFVPVDPGNSGLALGALLYKTGLKPGTVSPFLGPEYSREETKETLDNCKLRYSWELDESAIAIAVAALQEGRLVGWFDGAMEWGPRALGGRCILADPTSPYVLENLNRFLKRREPWRGYALSGLQEHVAEYFDGPASAPFMEYDYKPRDVAPFRHALPLPDAAIRVHTVAKGSSPRFRRLLEAFAAVSSVPFLVNTSFNGFHEPIVCSPRDAVRVFYGTGLDVLIMNQFVLTK